MLALSGFQDAGVQDLEDRLLITSRYSPESLHLTIKGMGKNHRLARAIADAGWYSFRLILEHKAARAGVQVVGVNARGTSQKCSARGLKVKKSLSVRWRELA